LRQGNATLLRRLVKQFREARPSTSVGQANNSITQPPTNVLNVLDEMTAVPMLIDNLSSTIFWLSSFKYELNGTERNGTI